MNGEHWSASAACASADPDAFFPEGGGDVRRLQAICNACPVIAECLEDALATDDWRYRYGIRAGLNFKQRVALKRKRAS